MDDVFCKIAAGEIPTEFIHRDDEVMVFEDIQPNAPTHLLIVPVKHYEDIEDLAKQDGKLWSKLFATVLQVVKEQGIEKGYRLIINEGAHGGKVVPHLHIHLLAGKPLGSKLIA